jgi:chemotaxis receptor (MCP) glutamine deamidase CheD
MKGLKVICELTLEGCVGVHQVGDRRDRCMHVVMPAWQTTNAMANRYNKAGIWTLSKELQETGSENLVGARLYDIVSMSYSGTLILISQGFCLYILLG